MTLRILAAPGLAVALGLALACTEAADPTATAPDGRALLLGSDPGLDAFVAELRRAMETGDALSMDALFNWQDMPEHLVLFTRMRLLPKGPMEIVDIRLEPMREGEEPSVELEGVSYELNVRPVGTLVVEMDDVSVGALSKKMIVGTLDGEFRLAGMRPKR
ncbi:MAG: hypothetical protein JRG96_09805 [Deltaproteobacteria bacterium]|nr:hypothetical protein [Deltaproteobacteria bacterium]MBW2419029.1 hypothetical protein [Deltaproteobacteria bacterium]